MSSVSPDLFPLVSIITVNFNGTAVTRDLLLSLRKATYPAMEVVVIDNGSKVPCAALALEFPEIKYLDTGSNLGFAGGNNRGIAIARGDYLLLLNNDTEVDTGFLEPLVARMQADSAIGVICPKLLYWDEPDIIQFAGFSPINPITGRGFTIGYLEKDIGQHNTAQPTSRAHGAAMMFSRKAFEKTGYMAEIFFLYYEEMDYCERFKKAGYSIWYEPASRIWHKESMATGKGSTLKTYYYSRNRLLYLRRNTKGLRRLLMYLYYIMIAVPRNLLGHVLKNDVDHFKVFWKGLIWNFKNSSADKFDAESH